MVALEGQIVNQLSTVQISLVQKPIVCYGLHTYVLQEQVVYT